MGGIFVKYKEFFWHDKIVEHYNNDKEEKDFPSFGKEQWIFHSLQKGKE